jgi:membrane protein involved in colicin uptake
MSKKEMELTDEQKAKAAYEQADKEAAEKAAAEQAEQAAAEQAAAEQAAAEQAAQLAAELTAAELEALNTVECIYCGKKGHVNDAFFDEKGNTFCGPEHAETYATTMRQLHQNY